MRKKVSKFIAVLFILATALGGAVSSFAANEAIRPDKGNLTIHKYWAETSERISDDDHNGTKLDEEPTNPAVKGIQFDVYLLKPQAGAPDTPTSDKDGWVYSKTDAVLTVSKAGENSKTYDLVKQTANSTTNPDGKTDSNGELKYTDLAAGYYYVEENLTASDGYQVQGTGNEGKTITSATKPFIVAVPMTNPTGDGWNKDVHVYPKNQGLNPEKKPNKPSINVGDEVEWTITANVPSDFNDYTRFTITDALDKRLNYVYKPEDIHASAVVEGIDDSSATLVTLTKAGDYTVSHVDANGSDPEKIVITLTPAGIKKIAEANNIAKISVSFKTTVNGNIASDLENIIKNEAMIDFTNTANPDGEKITTPPSEVDTGEIFIDKKESDGKTNLKGAEFKLASDEDAAKAEEFLKVKLNDTNTHIIDILKKGDNGYDTAYPWVVRPHETDTEKLGLRDGTFYATSFEGLQTHTVSSNITTWNSYWVVETKAPEEYNLLGSPVEVKFKDKLTNYVLAETILNKKGFTLPKTGGIGTMILVVIGIVLIGLAIILSMNKKKKAV